MRKLIVSLILVTLTISINAQNSNIWVATNTVNAPSARCWHTAVWSGTEMIIWGGESGSVSLNTGGKYNPVTDSWTTTSLINVPSARSSHTAVWTGSKMIIWGRGGIGLNDGGVYDPITNTWIAINLINAPGVKSEHTAVWTGTEMIVWGGIGNGGFEINEGGRYNPLTNFWTTTTLTNVPIRRRFHTAVWTGIEMIIWGGYNNTFPYCLNDGGKYNPSNDIWTATTLTNAPISRNNHTAVWTGNEMIIWGGWDGNNLAYNTGSRYNPVTDTWAATNLTNAPVGRCFHTAVWTGTDMIIWGGAYGAMGFTNSGGKYNPSTDTWIATSTTNAPTARNVHIAVWSGTEMIVWGGHDGTYLNTGGKYLPYSVNITPSSAIAVPAIICNAQTTVLGVIGGNLDSISNWNWYTGSCGGTYIISGASPVLSQTTTTTYWVRAEGASNTSLCVSVMVPVYGNSYNPISVNAYPGTVNQGNATSISETGGILGNAANWYWYEGSCWGINVGTGYILNIIPMFTTTYYVRAEGYCNTTSCISVTVIVIPLSTNDIFTETNKLTIYPNPTNTSFTIKTNESNAILKIYNTTGQLMKEEKLKGNESTIDIKDLAKGIYLIEVISENNISHSKIIKE